MMHKKTTIDEEMQTSTKRLFHPRTTDLSYMTAMVSKQATKGNIKL
ncbi:hypothetical protein ID866_10159 [Astraeus odoratus]|nr:hypothetical protein ID866_10159 [Astraeus odoratus]